jgi:hypothetical protein
MDMSMKEKHDFFPQQQSTERLKKMQQMGDLYLRKATNRKGMPSISMTFD